MSRSCFFRSIFSITVIAILSLAIHVNADTGNGGRGGDGTNGGQGGNGGNSSFGKGGDGGNGEVRGSSLNSKAEKQVDECEYIALKDACRILIAKVEKHFTENERLNSALAKQAFKGELSNYLLSMRTPASRKIHTEYEAVGWKYPAIKTI